MVKTLGCKANYSDGQLIEAGLLGYGLTAAHDLTDADVVIVNSCTVTDEADKQSQKMVRDLYRKNPKLKVIYTGCGAEVNPTDALKIKGVSAVIGNQNKDQAAKLIHAHITSNENSPQDAPVILGSVSDYDELKSRHPMDREWAMPSSGIDEILKLDEASSTYRTRAFIKIQEGCNSFCTYCVIPYGRGPARSLSIDLIVEKIEALVKEGVQEVIITGTNIGDYGLDWSDKLQIDELLEAILTKTALPRLRIGSLDPTEISDKMIDLMEKHEAFCPHFHVSLQHVSSPILKLMKRKYNGEQVQACLFKLQNMTRKPFIGMDYITGFPGESEAIFNESLELLKSLPWNRLHVFPYSERSGTPATKLPGVVRPEIRKERARILQALSLERMTRGFADVRSAGEPLVQGVLLEGNVRGPDGSREWISGYSKNYQRVLIPIGSSDFQTKKNRVIDVKVSRWVVDRASGDVSWLGETTNE